MIETVNSGLERENEGRFVEKSVSFEINTYEDPWMDNGLENFFRVLRDLESCKVELTSGSLKVEIRSKEGFIKELTGKILEKRRNLLVTDKDKKTGEKRKFEKTTCYYKKKKRLEEK